MCTLTNRGSLFILTLTGTARDNQEHRLNPTLISSLRSLLADVKSQSTPGSVLITRSDGKFFSNGFDLRHAQSVAIKSNSIDAAAAELLRMVDLFRGVVADLLSLPIPTIAAVTGHAAAAGMILAMSHDYVMMTSSSGVMYMSELDIGMTLPDYFTALIRGKIGSGNWMRDVVLGAGKVRAEMAVKMGIVDVACGTAEEVVAAAERKAEEVGRRNWKGEVYREIRKAMYPEVCGLLGLESKPVIAARL